MIKNRWLLVFFLVWWGTLAFAQEETTVSKDTSIVRDVDKVPQFPGGTRGWIRFVQNNMDITDVVMAMDSTAYVQYGLKQTAYLEFTVCEDGEICDIDILNKNKISPEFAREVFRIMKKSPKWQPAMLGDKPVRTRFRQPIVAVLNDQ